MSRRGWLLFASLSVIWGLPYYLIKVAVNAQVAPSFVVAGRLAVATVILLPIALLGPGIRVLAGYWRPIAVLAVIEMVVPFGLLTWAETRVTSSLAGLMIATVPAISAVCAAALGLSDRLDGRRIIGLMIGLSGVALLVGFDVGGDSVWAVAALIVVAIGYAVGPIILNTRLAKPPGPQVMAAATAIAAALYSPWLVLSWPATEVAPAGWLAVLALGALCTAAAFLIMYALVAEAGPTRMTVITYLNPVVAVALGVTLLAEPVTTGMVLGFPLILAGSVLATSRRAPSGQPHELE
ncbi:MAG: hypothetical protein QG597_2660 [Actinomycetota bacterium]|nr:hypothetical protein [Actinomycetota bacterium]